MGFIMGMFRRSIKFTIYLAVFIAVIVTIPNLPPYSEFTSIKMEPLQPRVGSLALNEDLNNAEKLFNNKLLGPEAFQISGGEIYTSLATGEIVKVSPNGHVTFVTKIGQPCTGLTQEHVCGRPLGFQIDDKNKLLYAADAYHGIWKVDLRNDKKLLLVSPRVSIDGREPKIFNSLALQPNGDLFWTDSSSEFKLNDGVYSMLADPTGRLFHYSTARNESKVLLDKLWFPNGVAISPDGQFVVVAETCRYRLLKYYIAGPKKGKSEVFVAGLPGTPDNLRALPDGSGVAAALYVSFSERSPLLMRSAAETPLVRKLLARLLRLTELPFQFLHSHFPHVVFEDIIYMIGHFKTFNALLPRMSGLVAIDWNGKVIESYYNTDGSQPQISDAIVYNDKLYLGSAHSQNYIGAVPAPKLLKKAFASSALPAQPKPKEIITNEIPKDKPEIKVAPPKTVENKKPSLEKKEVPKAKPITETPKPATAEPSKKVESKPTTAAPTAPTTTTSAPPKKPTSTSKTSPPPPKQATQAPKDTESKTTPPSKQTDQKPKSVPKASESKPTAKPIPTAQPTNVNKNKDENKSENKATPEHIPIKEDIPSDTTKPKRETLKVIKKEGPTEIPNPKV